MTRETLTTELPAEAGLSLLEAKELLCLLSQPGDAPLASGQASPASLYRVAGSLLERRPASPRQQHTAAPPLAGSPTTGESRPRRDSVKEPAEANEPLSLPPRQVAEGQTRQAIGPVGRQHHSRALAAPYQASLPGSRSHDLQPDGEMIVDDDPGLGETDVDWPAEAPQLDVPTGRSVTVIHGDKIDAVHYYGRIVDHPNTNAVRGGMVDEME